MTDKTEQIEQPKVHPLNGYKASSQTAWANTPKTLLEVVSVNPPPIGCKDSCGALLTKLKTPEAAAAYYRECKKLPADWPVKVITKEAGIPVRSVILPTPKDAA